MKEYFDMTIEEQLDSFFADTFMPHTKSHLCILFPQIMECYQQWCDAVGCPPLANTYKMGRALGRTYFKKKIDGRKEWFMKIISYSIPPFH